jgi:hypothetical protein
MKPGCGPGLRALAGKGACIAYRRRDRDDVDDPVLAENVIHPAQGRYGLNLDQFESTAPRIADDRCGMMARSCCYDWRISV